MAPSNLAAMDMHALSAAISRGVVDGTLKFVTDFAETNKSRHDLRAAVQHNTDKSYELDGEVKLLKGMMTSLIGTGDGSTGMVPRLERDMTLLSSNMSAMQTEMKEVRSDVAGIRDDVKSLLDKQNSSTSWIDGWKGVGVFIGIFGACLTAIGGIVGAIVWLYKH